MNRNSNQQPQPNRLNDYALKTPLFDIVFTNLFTKRFDNGNKIKGNTNKRLEAEKDIFIKHFLPARI